jgi:hypothetical protein
LPYHWPASDAKFLLSTVAATATSSIAKPRRHPAVNHDPLLSLDVLDIRSTWRLFVRRGGCFDSF